LTPLVEPTDLELIRRIATTGGRKYTSGNIVRRKYQRLVALRWLTEASVNFGDVLYEVTDAGRGGCTSRLLARAAAPWALVRY
jgi:hypothetical protein